MNLSIVTICYNSEKFIEKTMNSVLYQTKPIYEYIVIDGKSEDDTLKKIKEFESKFLNKNVIFKYVSEKDNGISDAFNKGIKLSSGDLIGLINADDELAPNACEILSKIYDCNLYDVYYGNCLWIDKNKNLKRLRKPKHDLNHSLFNMKLIHPSTFVKKSVYDDVGDFNLNYKYIMDKDFIYRCYIANKSFYYVDEVLSYMTSGGISDTDFLKVLLEGKKMMISNGIPPVAATFYTIYKYILTIMKRMIGIIFGSFQKINCFF